MWNAANPVPPSQFLRPDWRTGAGFHERQEEMEMAGIGSLFSTLSSALNAGNISNAMSAASALQNTLGTSAAVTAQAQGFLNQFSVAVAAKNPMGAAFAVQGLQSMAAQLPASVGPLISVLANPAIQADPAQSAVAVANIQAALSHTSFL
jgi:hypothetical protein